MLSSYHGFGTDHGAESTIDNSRRSNYRDKSLVAEANPCESNVVEIWIRALYLGSNFEIQEKAINEGRESFVAFGFERLLELIEEYITDEIFVDGRSKGSEIGENGVTKTENMGIPGRQLKDSWRILMLVSSSMDTERLGFEQTATGRWESIHSKESLLDALKKVIPQSNGVAEQLRLGMSEEVSPPSARMGRMTSDLIDIDESSQVARLLPGARLTLMLCLAPVEQSAAEAIASGSISGSKRNMSSRRSVRKVKSCCTSSSSHRTIRSSGKAVGSDSSAPKFNDSTVAVGPLLEMCSDLNLDIVSPSVPADCGSDRKKTVSNGSPKPSVSPVSQLQVAQDCLEAATRKVSTALAAAINSSTMGDIHSTRTTEIMSTVKRSAASGSPAATAATEDHQGTIRNDPGPPTGEIDSTGRHYKRSTVETSSSTAESSDPHSVVCLQRDSTSLRQETSKQVELLGNSHPSTQSVDETAAVVQSKDKTTSGMRSRNVCLVQQNLTQSVGGFPGKSSEECSDQTASPPIGPITLQRGEILLRRGSLVAAPHAVLRAIACALARNSRDAIDFLVPVLLAGTIRSLGETLLRQVSLLRTVPQSVHPLVSQAVKRSTGVGSLVQATAPVLRLLNDAIRAQGCNRIFEGFLGRIETASEMPASIRCSGTEFLEFLAALLKHADRTMSPLHRSVLIRSMICGQIARRSVAALLPDLKQLFEFFDPESNGPLDNNNNCHAESRDVCSMERPPVHTSSSVAILERHNCIQCKSSLGTDHMYWAGLEYSVGGNSEGAAREEEQICCCRCIALCGPSDNADYELRIISID